MSKEALFTLLSIKINTVLYIGVTSDLVTRIHEHKTKRYKNSFSFRYNLEKIVYFEVFDSIDGAIEREKQLKAGSRKKKIDLINNVNKEWRDLYEDILSW